jgi:hypothetical protein
MGARSSRGIISTTQDCALHWGYELTTRERCTHDRVKPPTSFKGRSSAIPHRGRQVRSEGVMDAQYGVHIRSTSLPLRSKQQTHHCKKWGRTMQDSARFCFLCDRVPSQHPDHCKITARLPQDHLQDPDHFWIRASTRYSISSQCSPTSPQLSIACVGNGLLV